MLSYNYVNVCNRPFEVATKPIDLKEAYEFMSAAGNVNSLSKAYGRYSKRKEAVWNRITRFIDENHQFFGAPVIYSHNTISFCVAYLMYDAYGNVAGLVRETPSKTVIQYVPVAGDDAVMNMTRGNSRLVKATLLRRFAKCDGIKVFG